MCLDEEDTFDNVIWSDESSIQLTRHAQTMRVKQDWKGTCSETPSQACTQGARLGRHIQKRCHTHLCVRSKYGWTAVCQHFRQIPLALFDGNIS